ncbi:MAG: Trk system potassium transporter TrkA [Nocardiopsis sp. BM-2018]|nr:MAG: Trk system potassium transporter TrkA [Nocardiopsis sp. BM-2018]
MNVVLVGGGEIGAQIASALHRSHNVTVLDLEEGRSEAFEHLDVRFLRGNGADPDDLRSAAADKADAFIACTLNDDINVLACLAGKGLGAKETMAFVTRQRYVDAFRQRGAMESIGLTIDRVLWPQRTLAHQIVEIVRVPRALDTASFAGDRVKMVEYRMEEGDPYLEEPLAGLKLPDGVLVAGIVREDEFIVPTGGNTLHLGDKVVFMGTAEGVRRVEGRFAPSRRRQRVTVIGGGNVGFMVCEELLEYGADVTIIEQGEARTEKLAALLPKALVLRGDGTDLELLEQERVEDSDVVVAVTSDDATNLLISLLAKQLGIPKVITRVGYARNRRLFERVGIDAPLTPRTAAVQEVLNWLKLDEVDHLATIEDRAEVMEVTYPLEATAGKVSEIGAPPRSLIGAILRKHRAVVPRGDTTIQPGDHLFLITTPDNVDAVEAWLERHERGQTF